MKQPVVIVGAGLAGLSLSIELARLGVPVIVLEKDQFPRQKVCGEYISRESESYLNWLGVETQSLPHIDTLVLTSMGGRQARLSLPRGGFGLSRWTMDHRLAQIAQEKGVDIRFGTTVRAIEGNVVHTLRSGAVQASFVIAAYGRSNRLSGIRIPTGSGAFVGVKYHVSSAAPSDTIEMHVFRGGYCGFSKVEGEKYCLCYLANAAPLKALGGNLDDFERMHLFQNPHLKERFSEVKLLGDRVTTSQFHFSTYGGVYQDQLLLGDASGFIPPITGNGMSLALRSGAQLAPILAEAWLGKRSRESLYRAQGEYVNLYLRSRIRKGVFLQKLLLRQNVFSDALLFGALRLIPAVGRHLAMSAVGDDISAKN
ncbi:MAG: NAD(P)/FAD-dependent oxidoreductase [Lunatimonas sp.]|uniref:NAD(P)/FAD-dependent oxidoreductase n=1 Tax=Lunatimonas sp. TaxID=2060141 RepID=UPI00263A5FB5|nr:NAD(P)/FAD-dependent oxidoreductase [Lunatimonas sp.]MCC5939231.1 NAD(P)/FAD-dependent oxidoreductase [Lunatimonas sp.]